MLESIYCLAQNLEDQRIAVTVSYTHLKQLKGRDGRFLQNPQRTALQADGDARGIHPVSYTHLERIASIGKEIGADYSLSFRFFRENMGFSFENILTLSLIHI